MSESEGRCIHERTEPHGKTSIGGLTFGHDCPGPERFTEGEYVGMTLAERDAEVARALRFMVSLGYVIAYGPGPSPAVLPET